VVCAIAGEWWKPSIWYHPSLLEQVIIHKNNCNKINKHKNPEKEGSRT
jgi:hypothetical protein